MSAFESARGATPRGAAKLLALNWALILLLAAVASAGFLMLYSVAGGALQPWARPQMIRFGIGIVAMIGIAMIHIRFWRAIAPLAYLGTFALLILVEIMGEIGMGAQRWIDLGFFQLQPSELMKIALVMALAAYYDWLDPAKVSRPLWVILPLLLILAPTALVLKQPDLGTALLLMMGGGAVMFLAGVSLWYFAAALASGVGLVTTVLKSQGTDWQLLEDYQFRRIFTFLDPSADPLGAGYHITQAKIAMGSGGLAGRGYMQGTQSRLNFLPEKHTDFIFTTLAEEFGYLGTMTLLALYTLIIVFCIVSAISNRDRFGALLTAGIAVTFFLFFSVNMGMVMGLMPVVGVPLPLVSYGGSAMLVLLAAFGLVQSAHVHRPKARD
ncbi:rod shape-determining protein RodA [Amaricoccus sp.]|uniref:rod shape-determining protein RodA n=1 Tax=Amaricoccus sp. TaxID=1872485 RepID=UPI002C646EDE|nr:rod shape-determining protein RodA [Amaricoccus sp.]HRW16435.1 rod shape-determining protein RodA [Amaricoccus sp.]